MIHVQVSYTINNAAIAVCSHRSFSLD